MDKILADLHLLNHPFYQDWMAGRLTGAQLKDYACQYYQHVKAFPRYISAIHSQCEDTEARKVLLENLNDEEGVTHGKPHPVLWQQFAKGMNASEQELNETKARPAVSNVINTFFGAAHSSYAEGLGALYAYEWQVPEIADSKIEGLQTRYNVNDASTLEFFSVHSTADKFHRNVLRGLIDALPSDQKAKAEQAAEKAARALWDFLSDVHGGCQLATA